MYQEAFCTASFRLDFLPFTEARRQPKETSGTYGDDGAERPVPPRDFERKETSEDG